MDRNPGWVPALDLKSKQYRADIMNETTNLGAAGPALAAH
jgi:hypothetical protein